jgi:hypothetical protein
MVRTEEPDGVVIYDSWESTTVGNWAFGVTANSELQTSNYEPRTPDYELRKACLSSTLKI